MMARESNGATAVARYRGVSKLALMAEVAQCNLAEMNAPMHAKLAKCEF